jgi:serine protease inhibitor
MSESGLHRRAFLSAAFGGLWALATQPAFADLTAEATRIASPKWNNDLLLSAQLRLSRRLVRRLAGKTHDNVMVSPASVAAVMSLLSSGADRQMQSAIHHVLGFEGNSARASHRDMSDLKAAIAQILRRSNSSESLSLANMIVFDPKAQPYQNVLARLAVEGTDVSVEDLSRPETISRINEWVALKTHNLIPTILANPLDRAGLVALNALYFKDKWRTPFDPAHTKAEPFHLVGGGSVEAALMYSPESRFRFRQSKHFIAAELPYVHDDVKLIVVTTKKNPGKARDFDRVAGWLSGEGFMEHPGFIALPRIKMASNVELLDVLDTMGLGAARQRKSSFRNFSATPQMLSRIVQKAELRIDEAGTEAAAGTAGVTMRASSAMEENYTKMIVDKPFAFALRNARTGLVLLSGYVGTVKEGS